MIVCGFGRPEKSVNFLSNGRGILIGLLNDLGFVVDLVCLILSNFAIHDTTNKSHMFCECRIGE